ncbi:phosphodiester glycosidase family protein [Aquimarina addita]|uniref:Phosphodiester glycosidase family protein n=1 Tax=Aquimarina addita TaxID=870485 RepID=A0ABP6UV12_9FLAO
MKNILLLLSVFFFNSIACSQGTNDAYSEDIIIECIDESRLVTYSVDPTKFSLDIYWKDNNGVNYSNFQNLETALEKKGKKLVFAMNGGMYLRDQSPQGLFIEKGIIQAPIDSANNGYGNFYLQPNGIFYLTENKEPGVCKTTDFNYSENIQYATQSGPMLLIDGKMHPKFNKGSSNVHIRNGVGILPNGNILFAISKEKINFYDFASYFKQHGCKNALYLDGFVSRAYIPSEDWIQLDGSFGTIIGVISSN